MGYVHLSTTTHTAAKNYRCDGCERVLNELQYDLEITIDEMWALVHARQNRYQILKGEKYVRSAGIYDGDFIVSRSIPAIEEMINKYKIYDED